MAGRTNILGMRLVAELLGAEGLLETSRLLRDIHQNSRTYRFIHHRSQKKLRRLARQGGR